MRSRRPGHFSHEFQALRKPIAGLQALRKPIAGLQDVQLALLHYSFFRPHSGIKGATPAEVFLRLPPAHLAAVPPPRGKPGQLVPFPEHEVEFLAPGLPVFRRKAA